MDGFTGKMDDENEVHLRPRKMDLIIEEMDLVQIKPSGDIRILYNNYCSYMLTSYTMDASLN